MHSACSPIAEEFVSFQVCHGWTFPSKMTWRVKANKICTRLIYGPNKGRDIFGYFLDLDNLLNLAYTKSCQRLICHKICKRPEYHC